MSARKDLLKSRPGYTALLERDIHRKDINSQSPLKDERIGLNSFSKKSYVANAHQLPRSNESNRLS